MSCFRNSVHLLFRFLFFVAMGRSERVPLTPFRPRNFSPLLFFLFRFSFFIFWLVSPRILKTVLCSHVSWHPMKIKVENSLLFFLTLARSKQTTIAKTKKDHRSTTKPSHWKQSTIESLEQFTHTHTHTHTRQSEPKRRSSFFFFTESRRDEEIDQKIPPKKTKTKLKKQQNVLIMVVPPARAALVPV